MSYVYKVVYSSHLAVLTCPPPLHHPLIRSIQQQFRHQRLCQPPGNSFLSYWGSWEVWQEWWRQGQLSKVKLCYIEDSTCAPICDGWSLASSEDSAARPRIAARWRCLPQNQRRIIQFELRERSKMKICLVLILLKKISISQMKRDKCHK